MEPNERLNSLGTLLFVFGVVTFFVFRIMG